MLWIQSFIINLTSGFLEKIAIVGLISSYLGMGLNLDLVGATSMPTKFTNKLIREFAALSPNFRRKLVYLIWISAVLIMIGITAIVVFGLHVIFGSYKSGIIVSAILWGAFAGGSCLLLFPSKLIITIFGGLIGTSLSEIKSAKGLITRFFRGLKVGVGGIQSFGTVKRPLLIVEICSAYRHING